MNKSREILDLVDESKIWDLEDTEPKVSDYDLDKERWGRGKGGEDDEPYPIGENNYTITELVYENYDDFDPEFIEELMAMETGDKMKLSDTLVIEGEKITVRGTFPVLYARADERKKVFTIKTKIEVSQEVWYERD